MRQRFEGRIFCCIFFTFHSASTSRGAQEREEARRQNIWSTAIIEMKHHTSSSDTREAGREAGRESEKARGKVCVKDNRFLATREVFVLKYFLRDNKRTSQTHTHTEGRV